MTEDPRPRATPEQLFAGRYRLGAVLGRGAMADVVHAEDQVLGRSVAVKIFRHGEPADTVHRIDAEVRTLASLSHPGLVTLYDAGTAQDATGVPVPYLVMELIDGPTLNTFRRGQPMQAAHVAHIGSEMAEALAYIHGRGVVHRDIKPANILIARAPDSGAGQCVKLADFGIARILDSERLTEHGTTVGTAHYLSPEQATGTSVGPPTDIYTLGLVLIECLTGAMVFEGSAVAAAVARLHRNPAVPEEFGPEWCSLLTAMTARRPEDRPDAAAVATRLRRVVRNASPLPPTAVVPILRNSEPPVTDSVSAPPRAPRRRWIVPGAAALFVALGAGIVWLASGTGDDPAQVPASQVEPTPDEPVIAEPTTQVPDPAPTSSSTPSAVVAPSSIPVLIEPVAPAPPPQNANPGNGNGNGNAGPGNNSGPGNARPGNSGSPSGGPGNSGNGASGSGNPGRGN